MMNYPCAKFGDCIFSRFGFNVRTDRHASHTYVWFQPATSPVHINVVIPSSVRRSVVEKWGYELKEETCFILAQELILFVIHESHTHTHTHTRHNLLLVKLRIDVAG